MSMIFKGIIWVMLTILQGFLTWIDICDAVLTTFVVWLLVQVYFDWNGWWALALGLVVSLVIYIIFRHRIGFWAISASYSMLWGYIFTTLIKFFFVKDMSDVWFWIIAVAIAAYMLWLHDGVQFRKEILADLAAEDAAKAGQ